MALSTLTYDAKFDAKISRLFIFRFLCLFVEVWIIMVWGIWIGLLSFIHFWYMLVMGQRIEAIWSRKFRFYRHVNKWNAYLGNLVDQRPQWIED